MIKINNVTYQYPQAVAPALDNLTLSIAKGESVCVMGSNGSGKSTLAKILAQLYTPTMGEVELSLGNNSKLPVGMLFQRPDNQFVAATVEKELVFTLENLAVPFNEMETALLETLNKFSIQHLRKRLISELSGGEMQRVALASVMIFKPSLLILDEPDSFLDVKGRNTLDNLLSDLRIEAPDMILLRITQYLSVARKYDRLLVMHEGQITADSKPDDVFNNVELCQKTGLKARNNSTNKNYRFLSNTTNPETDHAHELKLTKVSFNYPGMSNVFESLSCGVSTGETLAIVGNSGSGKSTLGNIFCKLLEPVTGNHALMDIQGSKLEESKSKGIISGVFQFPERQFFLSNCEEEVRFGPKNFGNELSKDQLNELFDIVGLDFYSFAHRDPMALSMGEKRRLAFAVVLAISPKFIVFDEPTCALDPEGVSGFVNLSLKLKESGIGQIIISHDGDLIKEVSDKILYLKDDKSYEFVYNSEFFKRENISTILNFQH